MSVKTTRVSMVATALTRLMGSHASVRLGTMVPHVKQVCILQVIFLMHSWLSGICVGMHIF